MDLELGNKELIEKLPKEGVHCYPANASKITRNRIVSVIFFVIGVFLVLVGLLKVSDNMIKLGLLIVGGLSAVISILVFAQSFLIAKFRVAVDYNEKNVVLRYRYSKIAIPFENFDGRDGTPDQAEAIIDKNFKKDATYYLILDDVFEDACYQTSSSDLESVDDFKQLREECFAIAEAYGARNSKDKVKFYYEKSDSDVGSTEIDAVIEETRAEKKADEEAEALKRAEEQAAREAEEAAKEAEEKAEEKSDEE
ncbi:hypothetical protein B0O40_0490 [Ruminococcaceae bacterium R-25]|nr:hypothetical protein B0O40_0490 [Ruminococcaceae bacterium R-25]SUQ11123.1 hypothetical protein SAMN06297423_0490 [Oscillospiraceae bacterium]